MPYTACIKPRFDAGKTHRFHPDSGWCIYGCGNRDDGHTTNRKTGNVITPGPEYTTDDLLELAARMEHR